MRRIEEFECYEAENPEDIAASAHHKIDILAELLLEKGLFTPEELKAKMDEMAIVDEATDEEEVDGDQ